MVSGMSIGAFLAIYFSAGVIYDYQDSVRSTELPPVDAIVVLAGAKGRIQDGGEVWHRYWKRRKSSPPAFYIAGMGPQADWSVLQQQVDPEVMKVLDREWVVMETQSADTMENAQWAARHAREKGWRRILLVTSSYHMKRASYIFERVLNGPLGRPASAGSVQPIAAGDMVPGSVDPARGRRIHIETLTLAHEPFLPDRWQQNAYGVRVTVIEFVKWIYYRMYW